MIFSQTIQELKKGCKKQIYSETYYNTYHICGDNRLCEDCQIKLLLAEKLSKEVEEVIDNLVIYGRVEYEHLKSELESK